MTDRLVDFRRQSPALLRLGATAMFGAVAGGIASHGPHAAVVSAATGCAVLFPAFRLAPEHPPPAALDDDQRTALEVIAVGEPIRLDVLHELADAAAVERLEAAGVVAIGAHGGQVVARPAHPLYGDVVRSAIPELRRRRMIGLLADPRFETLVTGRSGFAELPEVLGMSDRILVMREGRIVAELDGPTATQESVMTLAASAEEEVA